LAWKALISSWNYASTHFTEAGSIPSDSQIVGHTRARANKDGSPDRRFHENYQIPVAHYGTLLFTSPDGLDVRYLCSHPALAERFVKGWSVFRRSLNNETTTETTSQSFPAEETPFNVTFGKFKAAHAKFTSTLITPTGKGTMLKDDFMVYMAAVVALIDAARVHVANSHFSRPAKAKFFTAIDTFETKKNDFEKAVGQGTMNTESFTTYANSLVAFLDGIRAASGQE
jgi:hypothetical protein